METIRSSKSLWTLLFEQLFMNSKLFKTLLEVYQHCTKTLTKWESWLNLKLNMKARLNLKWNRENWINRKHHHHSPPAAAPAHYYHHLPGRTAAGLALLPLKLPWTAPMQNHCTNTVPTPILGQVLVHVPTPLLAQLLVHLSLPSVPTVF